MDIIVYEAVFFWGGRGDKTKKIERDKFSEKKKNEKNTSDLIKRVMTISQ